MSGPDRGRDGAPAGCPVCGRVVGPEPQCTECGWTLRSPLRAGPVTPQLRDEFTLRLRDARHALDARIAARVSADPAPYSSYIRGGVPDDAQWAAARESARLDAGDAVDEATLRADIADLASGLRADAQAAIVEVSADGIAVAQVGLDRFGTPWLDRAPGVAWVSVLPMLSADERERHFQLAGGLSGLDRSAVSEDLRRGLPDIPHGDLLLVCRSAGWLVLEWAAATLRASRPDARFLRVAGAAGDIPAAAVLASLTTEAPLPDAYLLKVAVVDDVSGEVRTQDRQIFAPGDIPGTESCVSLRRPPGNSAETALAIFSASDARSEPLALYSLPLPPEPTFDLRIILDGPGRMRIVAPPGATTHPGTWAQVRSEIPDRLDVTAGPADLVCAVDLAGPTPVARARLRLVRSLLELLSEEYAARGQLRVSVLTCTDHDFERGREKLHVVRGIGLSPVPKAADWSARQSTVKEIYPPAAPMEDLLYEAAIKLEGSRAAGRSARLLILGGRRPHPVPRGTENIQQCPHGYKWRQYLKQLVGTAGARCVAVADAVPNDPVQAAIWEELGPDGLRWLPDATARLVGEDLALLARHAQRIPIPLPNEGMRI
jgi:hypothetical protein